MRSSARIARRAVEGLRYNASGPSQQILWDDSLRGFGVRVYASGRKAYVLRYRASRGRAGRQRLLVLGPTNVLTLDEARTKARVLLAQALEGADPAEIRERTRSAPTFAQMAWAYLEQNSRKRSAGDDDQRTRDYLLPLLGTRRAIDINRVDLHSLHQRVALDRSGATANRILALASALFTWGERSGWLPSGHPNPARGIPRFKETSRARWLTHEEVRKLLASVAKDPNPYVRAFVWIALLTGARKSELLAAKWMHVSFEERILRLPRTKAGNVHEVPLSSAALHVLGSLPRTAEQPYVFAGIRVARALVNIDKPWRRICRAAGVEDVRLHDLRRTLGSWMAQSGAGLPLVGSILNHASTSTTAVYARLADVNRRLALEAHGQAVLDAAGFAP
jgi:integrase